MQADLFIEGFVVVQAGDLTMTLTGAGKAAFRAQGQKLAPTVFLGKAGATKAVFHALDMALAGQKLVKVRLLLGDAESRAECLCALSNACQATCVGVVGRNALFIREDAKAAENAGGEA